MRIDIVGEQLQTQNIVIVDQCVVESYVSSARHLNAYYKQLTTDTTRLLFLFGKKTWFGSPLWSIHLSREIKSINICQDSHTLT